MSLALILALQAAAAAPAPAPPALWPLDFDLARLAPAAFDSGIGRCDRAPDPSAILVCARRRGGAYPLAEMERLFAARPLRAEMGLPGGSVADLHVEQVALDRGAVSNRVTIRIGMPF